MRLINASLFRVQRGKVFMSLHFAFLVLEEHPYGREMLRILLENNLVPSVIIQEISAVGDVEREKFLTRMAGQSLPPSLTQLITGKKIPVFCVANHNDAVCKELLADVKPDGSGTGRHTHHKAEYT
jgi:methionyl-tRNA formyltransferase